MIFYIELVKKIFEVLVGTKKNNEYSLNEICFLNLFGTKICTVHRTRYQVLVQGRLIYGTSKGVQLDKLIG